VAITMSIKSKEHMFYRYFIVIHRHLLMINLHKEVFLFYFFRTFTDVKCVLVGTIATYIVIKPSSKANYLFLWILFTN
jgi:hypothetical protein